MKDYDPALDGAWLPVAAFVAGEAIPVSELRIARLILEFGSYRILDHAQHVVDRGEMLLDMRATPRAMNLMGIDGPNAGRTLLAIYELANDTLSICYDMEQAVRPTSMQSQPDQVLLLITYARDARLLS